MPPRKFAVPLAVAACLAALPAASPAATAPPTFDAPVKLAAPNFNQVAVGDFDRDGRPDIAATNNSGSVAFWLATGVTGAPYQRAPDQSPGTHVDYPTPADLDGDGTDELIVSDRSNDRVKLLSLGGPFGAGSVTVDSEPAGADADDIDGDGDIDLVVSSLGSNSISVLTNDGDGGLTRASYDVGCITDDVAIGDVTGDERPDVSALCAFSSGVAVLRREDSGLVQIPSLPSACGGGFGAAIAAGSFDGDAKDDLVVTCGANRFVVYSSANGLTPLPGPETSAAEPYFKLFRGTGIAFPVAATDLNGDGADDVTAGVQSGSSGAHLRIATGDGRGRFLPQRNDGGETVVGLPYLSTTQPQTLDLTTADLDDDGKQDIVAVIGNEIWVLRSTTPMPGVRTGAARYFDTGSELLEATVNPSGDNPTTYRFEYGTTTAYGESTQAAPAGSGLTGSNDQPVSALADTLAPDTVYHYRVVATNGFGTTYGRDRTFRTGAAAPANRTRPSISGTRAVGSTVTCAEGDWDGSPSFAFAWLRDGAAIPGATGRDYAASADDAGTALQCEVTATNAGGWVTAVSAPAVIPAPSAPSTPNGGNGGGGDNGGGTTTTPGMDGTITGGGTVSTPNGTGLPVPLFTRMPSIAGNPVVGSVLTCRTGAVTESPRLSIVWRRNGVAIAGQTAATYKVVARDVRKALQCRVSAAGEGGTTVADSNVATAHLAPCVVPKLTGLTVGMARTALKAASCRLGKVTRAKSRVRSFRVVSSSPGRGKRLAPGSRVAVVLSTGR